MKELLHESKDCVGKTIESISWCPQCGNDVFLVFEDDTALWISAELDDNYGDPEISLYIARPTSLSHSCQMGNTAKLEKAGIVTEEEVAKFREEWRREAEERRKNTEIAQEKAEREHYERLKKKYDPNS